MPTYISLVQFTDKGIQAAKETTHPVADWSAKVHSMGVSIKQMYWTLGQYDQVCVFEAPDDETAASVSNGRRFEASAHWEFIFAGRITSLQCVTSHRCGEMIEATDLKCAAMPGNKVASPFRRHF
jgi:GYD domain